MEHTHVPHGTAISACPAKRSVAFVAWRQDRANSGSRMVPEETAVALSYNRVAYAVMMASPTDLRDFAIGFSLNEGIVGNPDEIDELAVVPSARGVELRMWIGEDRMGALLRRRRQLAGASGCGLCGLESLDAALRTPPRVTSDLRITPGAVSVAMAALAPAQHLNRATRAVHAAALWTPGQGLVAVREDVGRHNALDKLAGSLVRQGLTPANGLLLLTSRVSIELVQKAATMGVGVLAAVSAPTALALAVAEETGITLIGVARPDGFEVYTHPGRVVEASMPCVA